MTTEAGQKPPVRTCTVHKDHRGYGLTVHGTRPVIVQSVRAEGAAWMAGIREKDEILEVNGVSVEGKSHSEVVKLIKEKPSVEFKVTAGTGRRANGSSTRNRTTTTKTTVTLAGDRRSTDPEHFREISAISPEAAKHLRGSDKSQDGKLTSSRANNDASVKQEPRTAIRASVTSPRPWVSALQHSPAPLLEEPPDEAAQFPLTHTKSCSMPEQASGSLAAPKPIRSKSDAHSKRRPVSMDVASLEPASASSASAAAASASSSSPTPSPASSNSNLASKPHSKVRISFLQKHPSLRMVSKKLNSAGSLKRWMSNPRVDDTSSEDHSALTMTQASATLPPPPSSSITAEEEEEEEEEEAAALAEGASLGHRRTQSLELSEGKMREQAFESSPIIIDDDEMECEAEHILLKQQIEMFSDLSVVLDRCDLSVTVLSFGHTKSSSEEGIVEFHRFLFLLVMLEYRKIFSRNEKEFMNNHKRIAYEIFSSFLAPDSPLNVGLAETIASEVAEPFKRDDEDISPASLKSLLLKAQESTALSMNLLKKFRSEAERGLDTMYTSFDFCNSSKFERHTYFENMMGKLNTVVWNQLGETPKRNAILAALGSALRHFNNSDEKKPYRSMENIAQSSVIPFNTAASKSKSVLFGGSRQKKTTVNGHSLTLKHIETLQTCDLCERIISGTAPQAEVCHHCSCVVHRECRSHWRRICDRDSKSKRSSVLLTLINKGQGKRDSTAAIYEGAKKKPVSFREGSEPPPATSPNAESRNVQSIVSKINSGDLGDDREFGCGASLPEERLSRSESMKLTPRHNAAPWTRSDSQHLNPSGQAAESMSLPPSSSELPDRSPSISVAMELDSPEEAEADVKKRLELDPLLQGLPADVQEYFQVAGFRDYYERLGREGSRKGRSYLKDYQTSCCEIYFQELSHLRNLKVMQYMFVEPWPASSDDLKQMMGLDKIGDIIKLRTSLVEELKVTLEEEDGKKFVNMGQGYLNWLTKERMDRLKCRLGSIRYKGENYYDKLLAERHKRLSPLLDRTFNKLNLFDMMISVNQHACRPSLLMAPVKKALGKLMKSDEARYKSELETWKKAEAKLNEVAHYLDQLKRRVVDVIPKIDATKIRDLADTSSETDVPNLKDVPRCLNSYLFLRDADCYVRKEREGKTRDTRVLQFADFLVLLYQEAKDAPERYVMRSWEHIMPILPHSHILHVINDRTAKTHHTLLLAIATCDSAKDKQIKDAFMYMTFKSESDMLSFKSTMDALRPRLVSARGVLGSSVSMSEPKRESRVRRSESNASTQSAMPSFSGPFSLQEGRSPEDKNCTPQLERQDSGDNQTLRQNSSGSAHSLDKIDGKPYASILAALRETRELVMARQQLSEAEFEKVADVMETDGVKDRNDLEVVLVAHLSGLAEQLSRLTATSHDPHDDGSQEAVEQMLQASQRFQNCLLKYSRASDLSRHSVFEESMTESQATSSFYATPSDEDPETEEASKTAEADTEEEETEEEEVDDEAEEERKVESEEEAAVEAEADEVAEDEEDGTPVAMSDEDSETSQLRTVASEFVKNVLSQALERYKLELNHACGADGE